MILIDPISGELKINKDLTIPKSITLEAFKESPLFPSSKIYIENQKYISFVCNVDADFTPILFFTGSKLAYIEMVSSKSIFKSLSFEALENEETSKKQEYDSYLLTIFGTPPPYIFNWGEVSSDFDSLSGFSKIHLRYNSSYK